eukprot:11971168-Ditylum_brightwellii.AAC.1
MGETTEVYNNNMVCVNWAQIMITKGLHHVQMHKNAVREAEQSNFATISHVGGKINLSNILTKEVKDTHHIVSVCDTIMSDPTSKEKYVSAAKRTIPAGKILDAYS